MTPSRPHPAAAPPYRAFARALAGALVCAAVACAREPADIADLCSGGPATATIEATVDTVRPPAGAALLAWKGQNFRMRLTFAASAGAIAGAGCDERSGTATFEADFPDPIRNATAASREASWRIQGEMVMLDLNPGTRDNNVFVAIPLKRGEGHWGLSTFVGEVAGGRTRSVP